MENTTNVISNCIEIRKVDEIGRIAIPIDKRKFLKINVGEKLAIYESGQNIIIKKLEINNIRNMQVILDNDIQLDIHISKINQDHNSKNKIVMLRTIDELGRIVIPTELRKKVNIKERK